jgi:hypothetical protein
VALGCRNAATREQKIRTTSFGQPDRRYRDDPNRKGNRAGTRAVAPPDYSFMLI